MSLKSGSYAFTSTGDFALTSANFVEDVEDRVDVEDVEEGVGMKGVYAAVSSFSIMQHNTSVHYLLLTTFPNDFFNHAWILDVLYLFLSLHTQKMFMNTNTDFFLKTNFNYHVVTCS